MKMSNNMRGNFYMKIDGNKFYDKCDDCEKSNSDHEIISVPHGCTDKYSSWGEGIPTTRRECTNCKRWDGPWVSSNIVGCY